MGKCSMDERCPHASQDVSPPLQSTSLPQPTASRDELCLKRSTTEPASIIPANRSRKSVTRRAISQLRLPSFEGLGIAAPHPDRLRGPDSPLVIQVVKALDESHRPRWEVTQNLPNGEGTPVNVAKIDDQRVAVSPFSFAGIGPKSPDLFLLTPPDESLVDWNVPTTIPTSSPCPTVDITQPALTSASVTMSGAASDSSRPSPGPTSEPGLTAAEASNADSPGIPHTQGEGVDTGERSLTSALERMIAPSVKVNAHGSATRVLSQTLPRSLDARRMKSLPPTPSDRAPFMHSTVVIPIIAAIKQKAAEQGGTGYIHVTYAVDCPEVNLGYFPSSPPLTIGGVPPYGSAMSPGYFTSIGSTQGQGQASSPGYFSPTIFNSVVHVLPPFNITERLPPSDLDHWDLWLQEQKRAPLPAPNPVVPPSTQDISVLERYIPPTSPEDDQKIFSNATSILVDRLYEVGTGGALLFVYPTKTGAETFCRKYLGPAIQPLLRRLMTAYPLPVEFCEMVEKMRAVDFMQEFEGLKASVENLCERSRNPVAGVEPTDSSTPPTVTPADHGCQLISSETATVRLLPGMWQEWWAAQERVRIANTIQRLVQIGVKIPTELMNGELERLIIKGVSPPQAPPHLKSTPSFTTTPLPEDYAPIEVGVFLIRKLG
ncbi:MAG: hypothetical protein M4579_000325 [Chaenotheca gracillima]|nr:MAG: hypothetical protein M4579_000325 [Chaenotheca gracillima]